MHRSLLQLSLIHIFIGLETALALGITNLVRKGHLALMQLIEKMSLNPAKLYKLDKGAIAEMCIRDSLSGKRVLGR